jgi:hypothetical protein
MPNWKRFMRTFQWRAQDEGRFKGNCKVLNPIAQRRRFGEQLAYALVGRDPKTEPKEPTKK